MGVCRSLAMASCAFDCAFDHVMLIHGEVLSEVCFEGLPLICVYRQLFEGIRFFPRAVAVRSAL
jgi:hypothetical protein